MFDCVARLGWLNRMTQFKEKAGKDREAASVGLYNYPVLMAADILVYRATHVPVGDDQKQHLELARDIAQKFNNDFGASIAAHGHGDAYFPLPEPLIQGPATRVMSLRDGSKKMSKSDTSENAYIALTDDADAIAQKIRRAKTDPEPLPSEVEGLRQRPEADNLIGIFAALSDETKEDALKRFGGAQFSAFKTALADLAIEKLAPFAPRCCAWRTIPPSPTPFSPRGRKRRGPSRGRTWMRSRTSSASCDSPERAPRANIFLLANPRRRRRAANRHILRSESLWTTSHSVLTGRDFARSSRCRLTTLRQTFRKPRESRFGPSWRRETNRRTTRPA